VKSFFGANRKIDLCLVGFIPVAVRFEHTRPGTFFFPQDFGIDFGVL